MKKTVTERRLARLARAKAPADAGLPGTSDAGALPAESIPHQAITAPPIPTASQDMASGGLPLVRGNSNLQPMTPKGHQTIQGVGADLARLGGPDEIIPSTAQRTTETGNDLAQQTGAPVMPPDSGLESRGMGQLEGEEKTPEVKAFLRSTIRNLPNFRIPGQGAMSNRPGESTNEFKQRVILSVRGLMQRLAGNPNSRIVVPTSSQVIRLVKSWAKAGSPDDFSIDVNEMAKDDDGKPGEMERFFPEPSGQWGMTPFSPKSAKDFPGGIYFIRHGETNALQAETASGGQKARAQIVAHVRAGNYHGAREVAKAAHGAGHLSDDEISSAIDEALPSAQDAQGLPPEQLLAAISAAGPQKKAELSPVAQKVFGNLSGVSVDGRQPLRSHLGRLGIRA